MIKLECEETINMREAGVAEPESSHQNSRSLFLSVFTILHKYPLITDISNKLLLIFMVNYTKKLTSSTAILFYFSKDILYNGTKNVNLKIK